MQKDVVIYKQAAIDALNGLPTWWADEGGFYSGAQPPMTALLDPEDAVSAIANLPSTQQEIIHCKDCIWYELPSHKISENCVRWMKSNGILLPIKPDDFCSRAERRTNERTD